MSESEKYAWVTGAVDEETAIQAAVLGKCLARVMTIADTIVMVPDHLQKPIRQLLAQCFDSVIPVNLTESQLDGNVLAIDHLKLSAMRMEMYTKIAIFDHNCLVLQNCDEFFELEDKDYYITEYSSDKKSIFPAVFVIKPNSQIYIDIVQLTQSRKFCLFNFFNEPCNLLNMSVGKLPIIYSVDIKDLQNIVTKIELQKLKIISFDPLLKFVDNKISSTFMKIIEFWNSCHAEIQQLYLDATIATPLRNTNCDKIQKKGNYYKNAIAIVGHSCRFPEANSNEEFWELLINSGDGIRLTPTERFELLHLDDKKFKGFNGGFLKCPIDEFDAKFFGISPREAELIDPQQRLLLEVAWEALENAGINPYSLKGGNTGVFTGVWKAEYERLVKENTPTKAFHNIVLGNSFSATSARISYFLGLNGPNIATESGCSSSLVALHLACRSLRSKETNLGLVMGANIIDIHEEGIPVLAKDGHCKTFDEKADGFGRAEGIAVIVLKRFSDAIANGDRVMGIIRGSALSNEGTSSSFGTPSKTCQEIAIRDALRTSGVRPEEVDYVEAHGTGTPVGDPVEFAALSDCYSGKRENPLIIGSVKTNIGHTESAAGLAGIIKVILSMKHEVIPPHRNFDTINPNINLDTIPAIIPIECHSWKRNLKRVRIAGVSSFGISGTNVHVLLEEPPTEKKYGPIIIDSLEEDKSHYILNLSAKTENALEELIYRYSTFLEQNPGVDIKDLCFTTNNCRAHFNHRASVIGKDVPHLATSLRGKSFVRSVSKYTRKIGYLFTGQGSQYLGMAKDLYKSNSVFRSSFDRCAQIIKRETGIILEDIIWSEVNEALLQQCVSCQLSIFCIQYAIWNIFSSLGIEPDYVLGHSVGEYAAAVASGIICLEDALVLLFRRSQLISELPSGGMMAISCSKEKAEKLIEKYSLNSTKDWIDIAVLNSPREIVVAGRNKSLDNFKEICTKYKIRFKVLAASQAFHSRDIDGILTKFDHVTSKIKYKNPICLYISGTTGFLLGNEEMNDGKYWLRHARDPVNFEKGIHTLAKNGCNTFIEIGPRPILLALGMDSLSIENALWLPTLQQNKDNWEVLLETIGKLYVNGVSINWSSIDPRSNRKKLDLPTYPFQRQKYWINIPEKHKTIEIHPLLGKKISLVSKNETVYTNYLNLKDFSFIKDHKVANLVIMPAAGFLEIILAVGKDLLQIGNNSNELQVKDFIIESALELEEGKQYEIQVVATPQENQINSFVVCVHVFNKLNGWRKHAGATITLFIGDWKSKFNYENLENFKGRCGVQKSCTDFYNEIQKSGIHFGEAFQSLESVWSTENEALAVIPIKYLAWNLEDYIFHPIVLDAMLQAIAFTMKTKNSTLYLPVGIENCYAIGGMPSDAVYALAQWDTSSNNGTVALYNKENDLLCLMDGVRLVPTTITSFLNKMAGQKNTRPDLYHEIWCPRLGPMQSRMELKMLGDLAEFIYPLTKAMENEMKLYNPGVQSLLDQYVHLRLIKIFIDNGICLDLEKTYSTNTLLANNFIPSNHLKLFERIIDIFVEDGNIIRLENYWTVIKEFPTVQEIQSELEALHNSIKKAIPTDLDILEKCCENFWNVVTQKVDPTAALFGRSDMNILDLYTKGLNVSLANIRMAKFLGLLFTYLNKLDKPSSKETAIIRIIEIGGGSAATSKEILKVLRQNGISYQYTFTDISAQFFENAKIELASFDMVDYKVLDIEKDPSTQGFYPNYYDVVIASNVIHATKNLNESIGNIKNLIIDGGVLLLQEILKPWRFIDMIFGILESYWKFNDYNYRMSNPMVSKVIWDQVLTENNFGLSFLLSSETELTSVLAAKAKKGDNNLNSVITSCTLDTKLQKTCLVFCNAGSCYKEIVEKLSKTFDNVISLKHSLKFGSKDSLCMQNLNMLDEIEFTEGLNKMTESYDICDVLYLMALDYENGGENDLYIKTLNFCKYFIKRGHTNTKIVVVTKGSACTANQKTVLPSGAVLWGMFKSLMNESPKLTIRILDLDPDVTDTKITTEEIFYEMYNSETKFVCYREGKKYVPKYVKFSEAYEALSLPIGGYKIQVPKTKRIADVAFVPLRRHPLKPDDVEVEIKAMSLNFRDIFVIMKPDGYSSLFDEVGTDFAGVISRIGSQVTKFKPGDEVFGFGTTGSAASHIIQKETSTIYQKPSHFSIPEAATIASCHITAHYCLVTVANLKKNETVLIHVASGGVGLYAVQIAQYIGARIIVTAGSHRKRSYLRSLGLEHVLHSRDLTFGDGIRKITNGNGVDVVLNSLTSEGFKETTLDNCAKNARFVEIGKVNIWLPEDVQKLRPDVAYSVVDLEKVEPKYLVENIQVVYRKDIIKPVAYSRFDITNIRNALNYFMKAQHIGKIVLTMPETLNVSGELLSKQFMFSKNATYLITGGLGGIGLVVAKWMVDCGAGCLVLIRRSAPSAKTLKEINLLRGEGCRVLTFAVDVGCSQQCGNLFDKICSDDFPPLKGVIHSAGVLSDAIYANQTWEKYEPVFNAKIEGCLNLHKFTKDMHLEHFVLFSSMASVIAPLGQSNHCAANSFLNAFAHYRHSIGLPAQTINWGAWLEVGSAANLQFDGVYSFNPNQGISALQFAMSRPSLVQVGVVQLNVKELRHVSPVVDQYFEDSLVELENNVQRVNTYDQSQKFWEVIKPMSADCRSTYIKTQLTNLIKETLKLPNAEPLNDYQIFSEMGLDSLMSVELKNKIQTLLGDNFVLNALVLIDYPTISKLCDYLVGVTSGMVDLGPQNITSEVDENALRELIKKDCILPDDIKGSGNIVKAGQVRNILLTGGTGHLGGHLLEQILKIPSMNVTCLVRSSTEEQARKKIVSNFEKHKLSVDFNRISVVKGDVAQERFGLSVEEYNRLSESIDSVFHLAAKVSFVEDYMTRSSNRTDIRSVNVLGTINVLRFAGHGKTKRVFYSSSIVAINKLNSDGFAYEDFPDNENNAEGIAMGYSLTKFVSEKLVGQAISRGIPCIVIRYPNVAGNSQTGHFTIGSDFVLNLFLMAIKLGLIFNNEGGWSLLSADIAAELTMDLLSNDNVDSEMYNLFQPNSIQAIELVNMVRALGYNLEIVKQNEFFEKVQQERDSTILSHFKTAYGPDFLNELLGNNDFIAKHALSGSLTDTKLSNKVLNAVPNISQRIGNSYHGFRSCVLYSESLGILNKAGDVHL